MSFDDAVAAMEGAMAADEGAAAQEAAAWQQSQEPVHQAPAPSAPQGESAQQSAAPQEGVAPVAPEQPAPAVDTQAEPSFLDGNQAINPDTLPDEVQPLVKQLQAAFTRKTQGLAQERQQYEQLGSFEELQQAAQLYQQIQNPQNWAQMQRELAQLMQQQGLTPVVQPEQQLQQPGQVAPQQPQMPGVDPAQLAELAEYPELAPLANTMMLQNQQMQQMQQQMQGMQQYFAQQQEQTRIEAQQFAQVGEFQRQEAVLRSNGLKDGDMSRVYTLAHAYDGNLLAAGNEYEAMRNEIIADYLANKQAVNQSVPAPIRGGDTSHVPSGTPKTLDEAHDIAMETLRAQGLDTLDW